MRLVEVATFDGELRPAELGRGVDRRQRDDDHVQMGAARHRFGHAAAPPASNGRYWVDEPDGHGALAHGRRHAFGRAGRHSAGNEDSGAATLKRQGRALPAIAGGIEMRQLKVVPGEDEAVMVNGRWPRSHAVRGSTPRNTKARALGLGQVGDRDVRAVLGEADGGCLPDP
jgi:hypothetical protein